jgi:hypothetical protein
VPIRSFVTSNPSGVFPSGRSFTLTSTHTPRCGSSHHFDRFSAAVPTPRRRPKQLSLRKSQGSFTPPLKWAEGYVCKRNVFEQVEHCVVNYRRARDNFRLSVGQLPSEAFNEDTTTLLAISQEHRALIRKDHLSRQLSATTLRLETDMPRQTCHRRQISYTAGNFSKIAKPIHR